MKQMLMVTLILASVCGGAEVENVVPFKAEPFELSRVRLLDGPFKHAQDLEQEWLWELEPDRLLAWFRKEAGLTPKAEVYGGWENRGIAGHCLGHYLSGCSIMVQATGDERFRQRVAYMVRELAECQAAHGDGYVAAIPGGKAIFEQVKAGDIRSAGFDLNGGWVPLYTQHKIYAGLLDAYRLCDNEQALEVVKGLGDWACDIFGGLDHEQMQKVLACEHGGMNESLADLYGITGDKRYLELSRKFQHEFVLDPLIAQEDRLNGLHANTQVPKLVGLARRYELTGDEKDRAGAAFFWERVVNHHSYCTGGHCLNEHFGEPDKLNDRLGVNTTETCNVYNMLKLSRHLFMWDADPKVADFVERALYNQILSSQHPADGRVIYNLTLEMGGHKHYQTKFDSFTCCVGTGMENHGKYGEGIYYHRDNQLYVNLFIASQLTWDEQGVVIRQDTRFPDGPSTQLTLTCDKPVTLALALRHPYWLAGDLQVKVNGKPVKVQSSPSSYAVIERTWQSGDRIEIQLPMDLHLHPMPDNPRRAAVMVGPLVLAGELGLEDDPRAGDPDFVPVLVTEGRSPQQWLTPVTGQTCTFRTHDVGRPRDVTLSPFYSMHDRRYSVYWDIFTQPQWEARQAEYQAQLEAQRRLEAATVDYFQPGEMQPERNHDFKGQRTETGSHMDRKWRHASDGGWMSFTLKVDSEEAMELWLTYWGSDAGGRVFDILIDGQKIATQTLENNRPSQFYNEQYPIPADLTQGKSGVTVKLQAHEGCTAGGLYGARMVKSSL